MDIDERKYAEERLHLQAAALEAAANAIVITDSHGKCVGESCVYDDDWLQQGRSNGQEPSPVEIR